MTQIINLEATIIESVTKLVIKLIEIDKFNELPVLVDTISRTSLEMLDFFIFREKPQAELPQKYKQPEANKPIESDLPKWAQEQREAYYIIMGKEGMDLFEADEFQEFIVKKSKAPYMTETLAAYILSEDKVEFKKPDGIGFMAIPRMKFLEDFKNYTKRT
ncbi:MAG: hypothetical protein Q8K02_02275 [Flavobacterium sp.]|nr:hypothetical protein [Flavobacterium sp.]